MIKNTKAIRIYDFIIDYRSETDDNTFDAVYQAVRASIARDKSYTHIATLAGHLQALLENPAMDEKFIRSVMVVAKITK